MRHLPLKNSWVVARRRGGKLSGRYIGLGTNEQMSILFFKTVHVYTVPGAEVQALQVSYHVYQSLHTVYALSLYSLGEAVMRSVYTCMS